MYCPQCGHQIPDTADFCPQCGTPLHKRPAAKTPDEPAAPAPAANPTAPLTEKPASSQVDTTMVRPAVPGASKPADSPASATQPAPAAPPASPAQPAPAARPANTPLDATQVVPPVPPTPPLPPRPSTGNTPGPAPAGSNRGLKIAIACLAAVLVAVGVWFCVADPADVFGHGPRSQMEAQRQAQEAAEAKQAQKESEEAAKDAKKKQEEAEKRAREAEEAQKSQEAQDKDDHDADDLEDQVARGIASSSDYALEDTRTHTYTAEELEDLSNYQLFIVRNEIFARYGRKFKNPDLAAYFGSKSWYTPLYGGEEFDAMPSPLTPAEKANCDTILALEQSRNSEYLQAPYV